MAHVLEGALDGRRLRVKIHSTESDPDYPGLPVVSLSVSGGDGTPLVFSVPTATSVPVLFGPGVGSDTPLNMVVRSRLRGTNLVLEEGLDSWLYTNALVEAMSGRGARPLRLSRLARSDLIAAVRDRLPTCYGSAMTEPAGRWPAGPTEDRSPIPEIALDAVIRYWRRVLEYDVGDFIKDDPALASPDRDQFSGGSIAEKSCSPYGVIRKSTAQSGYEGAGTGKLRAEARFYDWLSTSADSRLTALYPEVVEVSDDESGVSIATRMLGEGLTAADTLVAHGEPPRQKIWDLVLATFRSSYLADLVEVDPVRGREILEQLYIGRTLGRLTSLANHLSLHEELDDAQRAAVDWARGCATSFVVAGRPIPSPYVMLTDLAEDAVTRETLTPRSSGTCGHGDMTILNMVWAGESLRLIDPRGHVGAWDPVYDLGKTLFSLTGFAACVKGALGGAFAQGEPAWLWDGTSIAADPDWLVDSIASSPDFQPLRRLDPHWAPRLLFAEATHYLADAPYRYAQGRDTGRTFAVLFRGAERLHASWSAIRKGSLA